jgi:hypothetical protein
MTAAAAAAAALSLLLADWCFQMQRQVLAAVWYQLRLCCLMRVSPVHCYLLLLLLLLLLFLLLLGPAYLVD